MTMITYDHPEHGEIMAVRAVPGNLYPLGSDFPDWVAMAWPDGWLGRMAIGYVTDNRISWREGTGSETPPEDDSTQPYEAYTGDGTYINAFHSLRGALAAIGNQFTYRRADGW